MKTSYDQATDSLYVELRAVPAHQTVELEEDVFLDVGADGEPVGYDIQHASTKQALIARIILEKHPQAAE